MVGRAKSKLQKSRIATAHKEDAIAEAVSRYNTNKEKPKKERKSLRMICREVQAEWREKLKNNGITEANAENFAWLTPQEEQNVVTYLLDLANRGFPLTHQTLKLHVDNIAQARLGKDFPGTGIGHNWTDRFLTRHTEQIGKYWSSPLDTARGQAVNPHTNEAWFNLLGRTISEKEIEGDCIWAADETGFQPGGGTKQRVFGPARKKIQHQQRDGNRENITVMVTICADGDTIPPACIYKGQSFSTNWHQDNTLQASVAHSPKGWTDGVIGCLWLQDFDRLTCAKANGRPRLLLVDGHNSHYTKDFLSYARDNDIHVLCYPAHTTHVYQGLDVAIFGALKNRWSQERDQYESSTRQKVTKANFVSIYGRAHQHVLTPENIKSAFCVTGVWPFNPDVVTPEMMAPSLETAAHGKLPLPIQSSPIRAISSAIRQFYYPSQESTHPDAPVASESPLNGPSAAKRVLNSLATTSAAFLADSTPLTADQHLSSFIPSPISPIRRGRYSQLLTEGPRNHREAILHEALHAYEGCEVQYKEQLLGMQSTVLLQGMLCDRLHGQLAAQQDKKKKKKTGHLNADGLPKLLTGDQFYKRVEEHEKAAHAEAAAQESRRKQREERSAVLDAWRQAEKERLERNEARREAHRQAKALWAEESARARQEGRRLVLKKPKLGKLEGAIPRPNASSGEVEGMEIVEEEPESNGEGIESDDGGSAEA